MNKEFEQKVLQGLQAVRIGVALEIIAGLLVAVPGVPGMAGGLVGLIGFVAVVGGLGLCVAKDGSDARLWAIIALGSLLAGWLSPLVMVASPLTFFRFMFYIWGLAFLSALAFPTCLLVYCSRTAVRWNQQELGKRFTRLIAVFWLAPIVLIGAGFFLPLELQLLGSLSCLVFYLVGFLSFSGAVGSLEVG